MSTSNPHENVGGTAKDGGISTADTVRDGGSDGGNRGLDSTFVPSSSSSSAADGGDGVGMQTRGNTGDRPTTRSLTGSLPDEKSQKGGEIDTSNYGIDGSKRGGDVKEAAAAHVGNENFGVGGTAKDGGVSTADTVGDGGPDGMERDGEFKP